MLMLIVMTNANANCYEKCYW